MSNNMDLAKFDKWIVELEACAHAVGAAVDLNLLEIKGALDAARLPNGAPSHASAALLVFRQITKNIQGVMAAHDKVLMALGDDPVFYSREELS